MADGGSIRLIGFALTKVDILGSVRCVVAFVTILLAPGYCLAFACNLLGFRGRPLRERLAWGTAVSFAVMPIVAVEVAKCGSLTAVCWLAGLSTVGFLGILTREIWRQSPNLISRWGWWCAGIAIVWVFLVVFELVDVAQGNHLYLSVTVMDNSLRSAFIDAVMRSGIPPANPLFWPGHPVPMRYYYFWYGVTAVAAKMEAATARQAIIASAAWAGFGLAAVVTLYCRHFLSPVSNGAVAVRRWPRVGMALALLAVTGLDITPALFKFVAHLPTDGDMEWWSTESVSSWMDSVLWVPHHIAGLVCCLFGFLLVWMSKGLRPIERSLCVLLAGVAFASAFGLSIWIPVAFAIVMFGWMLWVLVWERESRPRVPILLGAGLIAVLALLPFLQELRTVSPPEITATAGGVQAADGSIAGEPPHLLRLGVRRIIDPDGLLALPLLVGFVQSHPRLTGPAVGLIARVLLLFPGYFVELGFYGLILIATLWAGYRSRLDESMRTALFLTAVTLLITTFVRSTVIENNDFGYRSVLIAQFFLLLLAVRWGEGGFGEGKRRWRHTAIAMLWIGVAGTVYQAAVLRLYLPVEDGLGRPNVAGLSERAMALRVGFDAMDRSIPKNAVVQYNTAQPSDYFRFAQMLQVKRQTAAGLPQCGVPFGGDASDCAAVEREVKRLFSPQTEVRGADSAVLARSICGGMGVGYLVATRWDEVWADRQSWVWTLSAVVDTGEVRVVSCSG
jgi:hypothetical protein